MKSVINNNFNLITLVGMMGSGKTSCGNILAKRLGISFIDIDSIYESSDFRTAWGLYDRKRMNPETQVMSAKYKKEFDCKKGKERILTIVFYTKSMADGYPIGSKNISAWKKIPFDSVSEEIFSFVCFI